MEVTRTIIRAQRMFFTCLRHMSTKPKIVTELNHNVNKCIEDSVFKPKKHPGRFKVNCVRLPEKIINSVQNIIKDTPKKSLIEDAQVFTGYINARQSPPEDYEVHEKKSKIIQDIKSKYSFDTKNMTEDQRQHFRNMIGDQVTNLLYKQIYNWKKLEFNDYFCLVYFFSRAVYNYAVMYRIFYEIKIRCPDFRPKTLFDFGSGIGSVSWAADSLWKDSLKEYFCVDCASAMNDFASLIIREGNTNLQVPPGVFYRQFLPSQNRPFNLVVSAFSLFELHSSNSRLETLLNLWNKTEDYLIVVEQGSKHGFKLVLEARDFILSLKDKEGNPTGHVFAPCPHEFDCPRFSSTNNVCNFHIAYYDLPIGRREHVKHESFSYVVLKKGPRSAGDEQWPRIIEPVLRRSKHTICRMCTNSGQLKEVIFSAIKNGKITFSCAKSSKWGDLLPINIKDMPVEEIEDSSKD